MWYVVYEGIIVHTPYVCNVHTHIIYVYVFM